MAGTLGNLLDIVDSGFRGLGKIQEVLISTCHQRIHENQVFFEPLTVSALSHV